MNALPDTVVIDGIERPTRNSEGRLIHDTPEGIANFWVWFADSKAVDALGRPLVLFHGTHSDFDRFDPEHNFFAADASYANDFGSSTRYSGGRVMPVYLAISNPLDLRDLDGIIQRDESGYSQTVAYITFNPEQVKSATGNSGRFDPDSPSLTDAAGVFTPAPKAKPRGPSM